jgi:hypothetical protein
MVNLSGALTQLRLERSRAEQELNKIKEAISVLEGLNGSRTSGLGGAAKRMISGVSRRKMALAQRARWAKVRAENNSPSATSPRRTLSIAARRKIAAAQRARWARQKQAA